MLINIQFSYKAGGYPMPTYEGEKNFFMNISETENTDEILERAHERAYNIVKKYLCNIGRIKISNLEIIKQRSNLSDC